MWNKIKGFVKGIFKGKEVVQPQEEFKVSYVYPKQVTQRRPRVEPEQPTIYLAWSNPEPVKMEQKREDIVAWMNSVREVDALRAKMNGTN